MKKINWPKIDKLSKDELLWMEALYKKILNGEKTSYRQIRTELVNDLHPNFSIKTIDTRLVGYSAEDLTMFGVYAIDPKSDMVDVVNAVAWCMKKGLLKNPEQHEFKAQIISSDTGLEQHKVSFALKLLRDYGTFWRSATYAVKGYGYDAVEINGSNDIFDAVISFSCIEDVINEYYRKEKEKQKEIIAKSSRSEKAKKSEETTVSLNYNPVFRTRITEVDKKLCFVLMPFTTPWSDRIYKGYIRENVEALGLQCLRADNLVGQIIIEDIWTKINQAAFIIADVTGNNANVLYELGIVHTIGKPAILITQDINTRPFDFSHFRHYEYKDHSEGKENFSAELKRIITDIYKENYGEELIVRQKNKFKSKKSSA